MTSLPDFIRSELDAISVPVSSVRRLTTLDSWNEDQRTAFGTYLQNIYTGIERILQFILKERGENIPKSATWHYDLFKLSCANDLLPSSIFPVFEDLMKFRHRHIHGYGHMLDEIKLRALARFVPEAFDQFRQHITRLYP